jgi:ATP-binding cassette subfamily C protein
MNHLKGYLAIVKILELRDRFKLFLCVVGLFVLSFLDLVGIFLIGVILLSSSTFGNPTNRFYLRIQELIQLLPFNIQNNRIPAILLGLSVLLFISKTIFGIYLIEKLFRFLGVQSAKVTNKLFPRIFDRRTDAFNLVESTKYSYALTTGMQSLIIDGIGYGAILVSELSVLIILLFSFLYLNPLATLLITAYFSVSILWSERFILKSTRLYEKDKTVSYLATHSLIHNLYLFHREFQIPTFRSGSIVNFSSLRIRESEAIAKLQVFALMPKYVLELVLIVGAFVTFAACTIFYGEQQGFIVMALFIVTASRVMPSILRLQSSFVQLAKTRITSEETLNLMSMIESEESSQAAISGLKCSSLYTGEDRHNSVKIDDLVFMYNGSNKKIFDGFNLEIKSNGFFVIKGSSGVGKSTLIGLLTGFLTPNSGGISLCGHSASIFCPVHFALVAFQGQNSNIFAGSLRDNLTLYNKNISESEIFHMARSFGLSEFFTNLPSGLDTIIGEGGLIPSGGQVQRLALLRTVLLNPRIIILDEPTSALDNESEIQVLEELRKMASSKILLVVSHSEKVMSYADSVINLVDGVKTELTLP